MGSWRTTIEDLAVLSPYLTAHIQRFGVYATDEVTLAPDAYNAHLGVELATAALLSGDTAGDWPSTRLSGWVSGSGRRLHQLV